MLENNIFWSTLDLLVLLLEWIVLYILLGEISEQKTSRKIRHTGFYFVMLVAISIKVLNILPNYRVIISIILTIGFYKINYKINLFKAIIVPLAFWMMLIVIEALSMSVVLFINDISEISILLEYNIYRLEAVLTSKILLLIGMVFFKYIKLYGEIGKKDFLYVGLPICTNIFSILVIFSYGIKNSNSMSSNMMLMMIFFLLLLSSMSILAIVGKVMKNNKLQLENKLIREKVNMEYNYYMKIENNQEKVKKLYHDMKNHVICISNLSDSDDIKRYIENINIKLNTIGDFFNTGNRILDIILNEKYEICKEKGIHLETYIDFSKIDFIDMTDICTIFSNALDNSIQACDKIKDVRVKKWILIKVTYVNKFCVIKIENSKVNKILKVNNIILTNKKDKNIHGIGIKNIEQTVERYDGQVNINFTDNRFALVIIIPGINVNICPVMYK